MSELLAIDPGLRNPAGAIFRDDVLVAASRIKVSRDHHALPVGERCRQVAELVTRWYLDQAAGPPLLSLVVIEWPQIYRAVKSKGDPNDLVPLAGLGVAIGALLGAEICSPTPAEWIGQRKKVTTGDPLASPRGAYIWERLTDAERSRVVLSHDAIDAVGLGLWRLGRLKPVRVYPGAAPAR